MCCSVSQHVAVCCSVMIRRGVLGVGGAGSVCVYGVQGVHSCVFALVCGRP